MMQPDPHVMCCDVWGNGIPEYAKQAYNALLKKGEITVVKISVSKKTGMTVFEYMSNQPHDWTIEQLTKEAQNHGR